MVRHTLKNIRYNILKVRLTISRTLFSKGLILRYISPTQSAITGSKSTKEILEHGVSAKYVQS